MDKDASSVVDADSHVFEPLAIWEKYLDRDYRVAVRSAFYCFQAEDGALGVSVNGKLAPPMNQSRLNRQAIYRPGMTPDLIGSLDASKPHPINPGAQNPDDRLRDMDAMGVDAAVLFPTLFAEYFPTVENPDVANVLARAYNDWIYDFSMRDPKRLFPIAVLPMQEISLAIGEARRAANLGFKGCFIRPSFVGERWLNHPYYDPLWGELQKLGITASIHPSTGNTNVEGTSHGSFVERVATALQIGHPIAESIAYNMDCATTLIAFATFGHMERYPELKLAFAHSGISWVALTLEKAETYLALFLFNDVTLEPEKIFLRRKYLVNLSPWERSIAHSYDIVENVAAWGSRYPQHDAVPAPESRQRLERLRVPGELINKFMGGNAVRVYDL
jgi:predicted TIM-barrel fold metal-dependent hydrolase